MAACASTDHDSSVDPSSVTDDFWVHCRHPKRWLLDQTYGKWLVFKPKASGELDKAWHAIRRCVESAEFGDGCTAAKCSTALENLDEAPAGSPNGVICVYTTKEAIDEVGLQLIHEVSQTIRYKTDETTLKGRYAFKGHGKVTIRTLYWNDGKPSFDRTLPADVNPTSVTDDAWVHCKPVRLAPQTRGNAVYGKWLVFEPTESLDETWHMIRRGVESGEFGRGCTGAKCSTAFKPDGMSRNPNEVIIVTTTYDGMNETGMLLINKLHRDILYKTLEGPRDQSRGRVHEGRYIRGGKKPSKTWLYWNDGEPSFEKM